MKPKLNKYISFVLGIITGILLIFLVFASAKDTKAFGWGNQAIWDTAYTFTDAYVKQGGFSNTHDEYWEHVKVKRWRDWEDSDMLQIETTDGVVYYSHSSNIVLVYNPK